MAKRVTIQLVKQLICILMVAVVLAPIILVLFASFKKGGHGEDFPFTASAQKPVHPGKFSKGPE